MSDTHHRNEFGFALASLAFDGERFLGALDHPKYGPQIAPWLPANFRAEYARNLAQLEQLTADQAATSGAIHLATETQAGAQADVTLLAGLARESARAAFRHNGPLLRSEFLIAQHVPNDLASISQRAKLLVAACTTHAAELEPHGWVPRQTAALAAAVHALNQARLDIAFTSDAKEGLTGAKLATANRLYRQSRAIQRVARAVFTARRARTEADVVEARALFLLGEFPKRNRAAPRTAAPATEPAAASNVTGSELASSLAESSVVHGSFTSDRISSLPANPAPQLEMREAFDSRPTSESPSHLHSSSPPIDPCGGPIGPATTAQPLPEPLLPRAGSG